MSKTLLIGRHVRAAVVFLALALTLAACANTQSVSSTQSVAFSSQGADNATINGFIFKPPGEGPFPAVVLMHGATGTESPTIRKGLHRVADYLTKNGYAALIVESFQSRGLSRSSGLDDRMFDRRVVDAFGALAFLEDKPFLSKGQIGITGFSQGGVLALLVLTEGEHQKASREFAAAVAWYPACQHLYGQIHVRPSLILIGEDDDMTPAADCKRHVETANELANAGKGMEVELVTYPGATHTFAMPVKGTVYVQGHRLEENPEALEDGLNRMVAFFNEHVSGN